MAQVFHADIVYDFGVRFGLGTALQEKPEKKKQDDAPPKSATELIAEKKARAAAKRLQNAEEEMSEEQSERFAEGNRMLCVVQNKSTFLKHLMCRVVSVDKSHITQVTDS